MKIRYLALDYTFLMLAAFFLLGQSVWQVPSGERDMVYYNGQMQQIERALEDGKSETEIEAEYGCEMLFLSETDYDSRLQEMLKKGAVVLDYRRDGEIAGKIAWDEESGLYREAKRKLLGRAGLLWLVLLAGGYGLLLLIYLYFIKPFRALQRFSAHIAKGNFDFPLPVSKRDFFGAFTESFDIMREELKKAKEGEYRANRSKKELIAELSHDIKTPISAIKATCEVMQIKEKKEETLEKVGIIASKAEAVDKLVDNMFHATLEELEVLKVETVEESSKRVEEMLQELKYYGELTFENEAPECLIYMDPLRLSQVIDNIVNNAYKYAGTGVSVAFEMEEDGICLRIRDAGPGVPEEELALLTEKFYRGSNAAGKAGSGLGLYLAKVFMERMKGGFACYNQDGFVAELFLRKV